MSDRGVASALVANRWAVLSVGLVVCIFAAGACASEEAEDASGEATASGASETTARRDDGFAPIAPPTSRAGDTTSTSTTTTPAEVCPNPTRSEAPTVSISAVDFRFEPSCIAMTQAQGIDVTNNGTVVHNITLVIVGETEVEFLGGDLQPGQTTATEAFGDQGPGANTYRLFCRYHQEQGMEAFLSVSPAQ